MSSFMRDDSDYFGGAVLMDNECGSVSLRDAAGGVFKLNVGDDPEMMLSGLYEPDKSFERW